MLGQKILRVDTRERPRKNERKRTERRLGDETPNAEVEKGGTQGPLRGRNLTATGDVRPHNRRLVHTGLWYMQLAHAAGTCSWCMQLVHAADEDIYILHAWAMILGTEQYEQYVVAVT